MAYAYLAERVEDLDSYLYATVETVQEKRRLQIAEAGGAVG